VIILWGAVFSAVIFGILALTKHLRMPEEVEVLGLAYADVGFTGYKLKPEYATDVASENISLAAREKEVTPADQDSPDKE
jgi:hypothetical protein